MTIGLKSTLVIAGMGMTGKATAEYLASMGMDHSCCDDAGPYPDCSQLLEGYQGRVIKSPGIPQKSLGSTDAHEVINDVELLLRLTRKPVILVTGTNGKSTVVSLVEHMLNNCGVNAIACGNNGVAALKAYRASPDMFILELSSYQLENLVSLSSISAVVLNIGADHQARYEDMAEYLAVKNRIYTGAKSPVYPVDRKGNITFGNAITGYAIRRKDSQVIFSLADETILKNGKPFLLAKDIGLSGNHNYLNACASLALLESLSLSRDRVSESIRNYQGLPHRMEKVCTDRLGRQWINDSKSTNLHSLEAALSSRKAPVCLIMGGEGKGEDYADTLERFADRINSLITYGKDAELIYASAERIPERSRVYTVSQAVTEAAKQASDVLFSPACASFDQYRDFNERGDDFKARVKLVALC